MAPSGEAIVTINSRQWLCSIASTYTEIAQGLSNIPSMLPWHGMLFILGTDYSYIPIDMSRMMFPLDIIFISSSGEVVGVLENVQPKQSDVSYRATTTPCARYFMEVNAGEASGIQVGDQVQIDIIGRLEPQMWDTAVQLILASIIVIPLVGMIAKGLR